MDPLDPVVPHHSDPPPVAALSRVNPARRESDGRPGQGGGRRRQRRNDQVGDLDPQASHRDLENAVQVSIDGIIADVPESTPALPAAAGEDPRPHIDLTA